MNEENNIEINKEESLLGRYSDTVVPERDIAAIVVTYNRRDKLINCIKSLIAQKGGRPDIIIIDNASTDGTRDALESYISEGSIIYKNTERNIGGAGGFEIGCREAVGLGYKYLWLMDDDCVPDETALLELKKAHNKLSGRYGFLSSKVLWKDGSLCKMNIQKKDVISKLKHFDRQIEPIQFASFVSCFIKASVVKEMALPIGEFFIWGDDLEYTRRISLEYPCYYVGKSVVVHDCETNAGSNIALDALDRLKNYFYAYRNEVYIFKREGLKGIGYWGVRLIYHLIRIALSGEKYKSVRFSTLLKGTLIGLLYNPTIDMA